VRFIPAITMSALIIGFLLGSPAPATAQSTEETAARFKLGYVNLQRVLLESVRGQEAKRKIEKFFDDKQTELDRAQEELTKVERDYYETKPILNEEAIERKQEDIRRRRVDLKRLYEDAERDLEGYEARISRKMKEDIFELIKEMGAKEGYHLILNLTEGLVLYVNPELDVTADVIKAFDGRTTGGR
jgi:outer membrane protein